MDKHEIVSLLQNSAPLFSAFTPKQLEEIVNKSKLETFEKGEVLLEYGEKSTMLYVLLQGEAYASIITNTGKEKRLNTYTVGSVVGDVPLMTGAPSMATITASEVILALELTPKMFYRDFLGNTSVLNLVTISVADKLRRWGVDALIEGSKRSMDDPYGFKLKTPVARKILVINCGSSSLKYTMFNTDSLEHGGVTGQVERIGGNAHMLLEYKKGELELKKELPSGDHKAAFDAMIIELTSPTHGVVSSPEEIDAVGHRVVHGGDIFGAPTIITDKVIHEIEKLSSLAPLHNPINLVGIHEAQRVFPDAKQVAVFDTAFHHTIPPHAFLYGLPYEYYQDKKIRRYGFHGTSHYYVSLKTAEYLGRPYTDLKIISCHLGNGSSVCAIEHGRSVDTSMGLTPAEGVIMGTRCGNIDPAALLHLMDSEGMTSKELNTLLNKESGLLGLSGISNDMRDIEAAVNKGNNRAIMAYKTFAYSVKKYIGSYDAVMGGVDALVFTGGIGLYNTFGRKEICKGLGSLGMYLDEAKCDSLNGAKEVVEISTTDSPVKILIVPTNEELMIARETLSVINEDSSCETRTNLKMPLFIPVIAMPHHVHLTKSLVAKLLGKSAKLVSQQELAMDTFVSQYTVTLKGPQGAVFNVPVHGPVRENASAEITLTDQAILGISTSIREYSDLQGTAGCEIEGPEGSATLSEGVFISKRHVHMSSDDAKALCVKDGDSISIRVEAELRTTQFSDVVVRVSPEARLSFHIDTDEAHAANITLSNGKGYIVQ